MPLPSIFAETMVMISKDAGADPACDRVGDLKMSGIPTNIRVFFYDITGGCWLRSRPGGGGGN